MALKGAWDGWCFGSLWFEWPFTGWIANPQQPQPHVLVIPLLVFRVLFGSCSKCIPVLCFASRLIRLHYLWKFDYMQWVWLNMLYYAIGWEICWNSHKDPAQLSVVRGIFCFVCCSIIRQIKWTHAVSIIGGKMSFYLHNMCNVHPESLLCHYLWEIYIKSKVSSGEPIVAVPGVLLRGYDCSLNGPVVCDMILQFKPQK